MSTTVACDRTPAPSASRVQVGDIARAYGAALRRSCVLDSGQQRVLGAIERCRTAALGGHMLVCERCSYAVPIYNSCRNRHCPTCQSLEQHRWLQRRRERILPTPYFHVVFTLPAELRGLAMAHRRAVFTMMFSAARATLLALARDEKRLGAVPAITMVLHTWTRELAFHPHVHAVVSAGGLRDDPQPRWVPTRARYLFPVKVMAALFRTLFREALLCAFETGAVRRPDDDTAVHDALFHKRWVVYAKAPFGGAQHVFSYLGRYTHRVGISNARIASCNEHGVTFATKNGRTLTLPPVEFLQRLLLHVLPSGFHKIRHYGLSSASHVRMGTLQRARALLAPALAAEPAGAHNTPPQSWTECLLALTGIDVMRCPRCHELTLRRRPLPLTAAPQPDDTS